jgi:hypothetical protein
MKKFKIGDKVYLRARDGAISGRTRPVKLCTILECHEVTSGTKKGHQDLYLDNVYHRFDNKEVFYKKAELYAYERKNKIGRD